MSISGRTRVELHAPPASMAQHLLCAITRDVAGAPPSVVTEKFPANFYASLTVTRRGQILDVDTGTPHALIALTGSLTRPKRLHYAPGTCTTTVIFKPGRMSQVFNLERPLALNSIVEGASLLSRPTCAALKTTISGSSLASERAAALMGFVAAELQVRGRIETAFQRDLESVLWRLPSMKGPELSAHFRMVPRSLHRRFVQELGMAPKTFARLMRLHEVLWRMRVDTPSTGAQLASNCGFADQAHLLREFKSLLGLTPKALTAWLESADQRQWPFQLPLAMIDWCHMPPAVCLAA